MDQNFVVFQCVEDVVWCHTCFCFDLVDGDALGSMLNLIKQDLDYSPCPETYVSSVSKITEWSLWTARLFFNHGESITHFYQQLSVASPLTEGHNKDARQVVNALLILLL